MLTIFKHSFSRSRGQILGWGLSLAILGGYMAKFYDTLAAQQESLAQLLASYPKELLAMFGNMSEMFTPAGYLNVEFFSYMPLIIGIYAILTGSGLLAGDEESGTLDLVLSYPLSRTALYWGRLLAFVAAMLSILLLVYVGFAVSVPGTGLDFNLAELAQPFLSLLGILLFYGGLALLLSLLLPSRRLAAMIGGLLLVADFFTGTLARLDENLQALAEWTPLHYYQGGLATQGIEWGWFAGLVGLAVVFMLLAWRRFERRDIRVAGEGGWGLRGWSLRKKQKAAAARA
jgi:ABC-2 type transport system permease protein